MRVALICVWLVVVALVCYWLVRRFRFKGYGIIGVGLLALLLWVGGGAFINFEVLSREVNEKVSELVSLYGDTYIRLDGNNISIKIGNQWLRLSDIAVVGDLLTDDVCIEYDGEVIYLGHSGVVNVLRTLEYLGFLD